MEEVAWATTACMVVTVILTLIGVWKMLNRLWLRPKKLEMLLRKQGLRGSPYRFLVGDIKEMLKMGKEAQSKPMTLSDDIVPRVLSFIHQKINKHGKNTFIWFGPTPRVIVTDPELVKDVFFGYHDYRKISINPLVSRLIATGLVSHEGEKWLKHRRIINPAFNLGKLKDAAGKVSCLKSIDRPVLVGKVSRLMSSDDRAKKLYRTRYAFYHILKHQFPNRVVMHYIGKTFDPHIIPVIHYKINATKIMLPAFFKSCHDIISKWEDMLSSDGSCEMDVWPSLQNLASDVIAQTAFGSNYEDGRRIFQLQKEQAELTMKIIMKIFIPGWRFLPTSTRRRMKEIDREIVALLKAMINKRENALKEGEATKNDLLGQLLESNRTEIQKHGNNKNMGMTLQDVIEECKLFYFAGSESTSALLVWTMVLMSRYLDWQERAREEVLQVFGKQKPDFDGLSHLKIVTMILHEVLRLYPPGTVLTRTVHKDMKLGDLTLPAGVQVSLPIVLVHHDSKLWGDDANEFNPARFSEGISKVTNGKVSFFPFGWGPRICIGQTFAMVEAKMALSIILQHFSFELSPAYAHAPSVVRTLQPQYGAQLILRKL